MKRSLSKRGSKRGLKRPSSSLSDIPMGQRTPSPVDPSAR